MKLKFKAFAAFMLAAAVSLALFLSSSEAAKAGQLRYYALDVGQGDCSLFVLPDGRNVVFDAGPRSNAKKTVNYLKSCGVRKIDLLVASHPHEDHIGGMKELLSKIPVKQIWDSGYNHGSKVQRDFYQMIKDKKIPFGRPKRGYAAKLGDVEFKVLAPARPLKGTSSDANNNGLIVLVTYGGVSFLMMGDAQKEEQETVLAAAARGGAQGRAPRSRQRHRRGAAARRIARHSDTQLQTRQQLRDTRTGRPSPRFAKRSCCASTRRTAPSSCAQTANP